MHHAVFTLLESHSLIFSEDAAGAGALLLFDVVKVVETELPVEITFSIIRTQSEELVIECSR